MPETMKLQMQRRAHAEAAISLLKRRRWFADGDEEQDEDSGGEDAGSNGGEGKYNPASLDEAQKIIAALTKRVGERDATINELKGHVSSTNDRLTAIERDRRKKLEEEGNYRALLEERNAELESLKTYKERAEALDGIIRAGNDDQIKRIPEDKRGIVPTDYPPEKLRVWLDRNLPLLLKQPPPDFDAGAGNGSSGGRSGDQVQVTDEDRRKADIARSQGYDIKAEDIAKRRQGQSS
ncbi:MAG: hypothetical protein K8L99_18225 [Anaerolineae bacterium]|nr:hypothetical protein [Anaerolineae bacterium]